MCAALAIGCGSGDADSSPRPETQVGTPRPVVVLSDTSSINSAVSEFRGYLTAHPDRVKLFALLPGRDALVVVKDSSAWPDDADVSYNVARDSTGRPMMHVEIPTSQSGDWFEKITHWFGSDGRTIFYELSISSFSSGCGEILRESKRVWLGPRGRAIAISRKFTDGEGKPVVADSCHRRSDEVPAPKLSADDLSFPGSPDI